MKNDFKSSLEILGLGPEALPKEIEQAYRDLAMVWHPDRFQSIPRLRRKAEKKFREINRAYEILQGYEASLSAESNATGDPTSGTGHSQAHNESKNTGNSPPQSSSHTNGSDGLAWESERDVAHKYLPIVVAISFLAAAFAILYVSSDYWRPARQADLSEASKSTQANESPPLEGRKSIPPDERLEKIVRDQQAEIITYPFDEPKTVPDDSPDSFFKPPKPTLKPYTIVSVAEIEAAKQNNLAIFRKIEEFFWSHTGFAYGGAQGDWIRVTRPIRLKKWLTQKQHEELIDYFGKALMKIKIFKKAPSDYYSLDKMILLESEVISVLRNLRKWDFTYYKSDDYTGYIPMDPWDEAFGEQKSTAVADSWDELFGQPGESPALPSVGEPDDLDLLQE